MDFASCGNFRGPKKMSATTRMKSNSVLPRLSRMSAKNTVVLPSCKIANAVNLAGVGMPEVGLVG